MYISWKFVHFSENLIVSAWKETVTLGNQMQYYTTCLGKERDLLCTEWNITFMWISDIVSSETVELVTIEAVDES